MHLVGGRASVVDDACHLVTVYVVRVREQMSGVLVRFAFKTAGNVECSVGMKIVPVSCVQSCVSEFVADRHLLSCITEVFILNDVFAP